MFSERDLILHIGFGQFHRAHQADYFDQLNRKGNSSFKIIPMSLTGKKSAAFDALKSQNGKYTLTVVGAKEKETKEIEIHKDGICGLGEFNELSSSIKSRIAWITITATEKAYNSEGDSLAHSLCKIMQFYFSEQILPPVVVSCDNLLMNGSLLKSKMKEANESAKYFEPSKLVSLKVPNSLVDRIVPAQRAEWVEEIKSAKGVLDNLCVFTESYSQWVIEKKELEVADQLGLSDAGVEFVDDISIYNQQKLFLLNGAHSLLSYLGIQKRHKNVEQAIKDKELNAQIINFWNHEAIPVLNSELDHQKYCKELVQRFENPFLNHQLIQIAQDGFHKIRQRWLPIIQHWNNNSGGSLPTLAQGLIAFQRFTELKDDLEFVRKFQVDQQIEDLILNLMKTGMLKSNSRSSR